MRVSFFRVIGGRLVVFDRVAKRAAVGLHNGNIEGMVGVRADVQRNRGAPAARPIRGISGRPGRATPLAGTRRQQPLGIRCRRKPVCWPGWG